MTPEAKVVDAAVMAHWAAVQAWATGPSKSTPFILETRVGVVHLRSDGERVTVDWFARDTTILALRPNG